MEDILPKKQFLSILKIGHLRRKCSSQSNCSLGEVRRVGSVHHGLAVGEHGVGHGGVGCDVCGLKNEHVLWSSGVLGRV